MPKPRIDRHVLRDASWWHWATTLPLLVAALAGYRWAIVAAMVWCGVMGIYFYVRLRQLRPFPVQVRIAYLGLLAIGTLPWMKWIHLMQLIGTTTMVTTGYCPLIRLMSLTPINRTDPLTLSLMWRTLFQEPCVGGLIDWSAGERTSRPTVRVVASVVRSHITCSLGQ
jgi:hypothetical protein